MKPRFITFEGIDGAGKSSQIAAAVALLRTRGLNVVQLRTSSSRLTRSLNALRAWCASHRHDPVREQHATLVQKIRGHVQYFGVRDNHSGVARFVHWATLIWWKWLARRSRERTLTWARMRELLRRYPLPNARVVHRLA